MSAEIQQNQRRLTSAGVRELCGGVSNMWLWRRLDDDETFPRPAYINKRRYWKEAEIIAWLDAQSAGRL